MAGSSKKKQSSPGQQGSKAKSAPRVPAFSPGNHGLLTVDKEWSLSWLLLSENPGEYLWRPSEAAFMVGRLSDFAPLSARTHVRISFVSSVPLHFSPTAGAAERQATKWSSGWIAVDNLMPIRFRAFGSEPPNGYWRVESAGTKRWEGDASPRPALASRAGELDVARATAPAIDDDDE
jgi:hypothetical protein